jgi:hypothetical protein
VNEQQKTLNAKLRGHYQYYGRRTNYRAIRQFYHRVRRIWRAWLSRRTRGKPLTWERFKEILRQYPLLPPRVTRKVVQTITSVRSQCYGMSVRIRDAENW